MLLKSTALCLLFVLQTQNLQAYTILDRQIPLDDYPPCCETCCETCCDPGCSPFWVAADYLNWKMSNSPRIPPLVFTGIYDSSVTPNLQTPGTTILLGNRTARDQGRSGGRFTLGYNFCSGQVYGTDVNYFFLAKESRSKSVQSNDFNENKITAQELPNNSYLAIPFFDATTNKESSVYIAKPGTFAGKATLKTTNWMQGAEWNFTRTVDLCCSCTNFQVSGLIGFRYWNFNDKLKFITHSPNTTTPDIFTTLDEFKTTNNFYGGQIGFDAECVFDCFSIDVKAKIALGGMNQKLVIKGSLFTNDFDNFGAVQEFSGGYLALPTNIGNFEKTQFAYIPEVDINFRYKFVDGFTLQIGYSFLYASKVFWAENQIDTHINPTQSVAINRSSSATLSGIPDPKPLKRSRDIWVQGFNVGLEYRF